MCSGASIDQPLKHPALSNSSLLLHTVHHSPNPATKLNVCEHQFTYSFVKVRQTHSLTSEQENLMLNEKTSVATISNLVPDSTYRGRIAGTQNKEWLRHDYSFASVGAMVVSTSEGENTIYERLLFYVGVRNGMGPISQDSSSAFANLPAGRQAK